jgi:hypothetical protein
MGEKYSAKRKMKKYRKEEEETNELRQHSFRPRTSNFKGTSFDVSLAERTSRWAEKRKEKVKRKRQEIALRKEKDCSFKPKIVSFIFSTMANSFNRTTTIGESPRLKPLRAYTAVVSCKMASRATLLVSNKPGK